jgi:hypothetical protein
MNHQQPRLIALLSWRLSHEMGWQRIVEEFGGKRRHKRIGNSRRERWSQQSDLNR